MILYKKFPFYVKPLISDLHGFIRGLLMVTYLYLYYLIYTIYIG